jgi:hypothetical protein
MIAHVNVNGLLRVQQWNFLCRRHTLHAQSFQPKTPRTDHLLRISYWNEYHHQWHFGQSLESRVFEVIEVKQQLLMNGSLGVLFWIVGL